MSRPRYLNKLPESAQYIGDASAGEIEIIDKLEASKIRAKTGILIEDKLHFFVRDAVKFPSGEVRTQMRVIGCTTADGPSGVIALAWRDGKIYLREMFLHATRHWELETPRGQRETGFSAEEAARKEIDEELGFRVKSIEKIGDVSGDSALLASILPIFWAELEPGPPHDHPEKSEAFGKIIALSESQLKEKVRRGEIRDGYTLSAILFAQLAGKLQIA
ncbi:MAG: NUDIX domain-containing protein [Gemmatimonadota bacterium]|nr:NUDIX domain-containing protein [Gemmatimonadota bacterium]